MGKPDMEQFLLRVGVTAVVLPEGVSSVSRIKNRFDLGRPETLAEAAVAAAILGNRAIFVAFDESTGTVVPSRPLFTEDPKK